MRTNIETVNIGGKLFQKIYLPISTNEILTGIYTGYYLIPYIQLISTSSTY